MSFRKTEEVTTKDAIEWFEKEVNSTSRKIEDFETVFGAKAYGLRSHKNILDMAIAALREQEERSKSVLTNADRIRAMSDEELAEFMCDNDNSWVTSMGRQLRYDNYLEWLQQPAKEDV